MRNPLVKKESDITESRKFWSRKYWGLILIPVFLAAIFAYLPSPQGQPVSLLRIGVLPDQNPDILRQRYAPLMEYLAARSGLETRLVVPADYIDAVRLFREKEIDLAYFGGLTFVQAHKHYGALPLVMRAIDTRFTNWFLVRPELAQLKLSDLRDRKFSFGNELSTSGHLMPRHFLLSEWAIEPEVFFAEVSYSGAHDKTALLVRDGVVDVGAVNTAIVKRMLEEGRLQPDELRVLWQTPPYPDYVWSVQAYLDNALQTKLRDAFLGLDPADSRQAEILQSLRAESYLPASAADFSDLDEIAHNLGLLSLAEK